ncbi:MAG TPA: transposase [Ktedonobacteraceae bacterium]
MKKFKSECKRKRVVVFVALGFWQHGEKREIVDWQIAKSEGHEQWEPFLHRLQQRGITAEKGRKRDYS